jgi:PBSX family phage terminase large subunit
VGAVRSGKTFVNNLIFIAYLALVHRDDPEAKVILAGWSQGSIDTNVVSELQKIGAQVKKTRTGYIINGVRVEVAYTGTNRGADKIQGMTANFAYVNEAALSTEYVFNQIFQRVSAGHYQKILIDANPKGPTHWLKRDYIDKGEVEYTQYRLDDNLHLSADYIAAMKRVNKGDLYKRNILGEWSAGDLIIPFELFKKQDSAFIYQLPFIQGMDLGTDDPTTYVRAYIDTGSHRLFVTDAIFEHPKSTNAIGSMLRKYADERYATAIDTNFPPVNGQLMIEGYNIAPMKGSNNKGKIESGIKKLLNYDLFVDEHLTEMIKELDSYERDSSGEISKEAKKHDHSIDALRYALILYENTRLMNGR